MLHRLNNFLNWSRVWSAIALTVCLWVASLSLSFSASALTQIKLSDIDYKDCPEAMSEGLLVSGSSAEASCFLVFGKAENATNKTVYDADIFGRVYDANNNPVMQNRTRLGAIEEVPPGTSDFELRISVAANQPTPLKLEQFKATGFSGRVRR
ncbi:MAG: hypothetical protein WBA57_03805 [Elainellaceae cyanobacterium]